MPALDHIPCLYLLIAFLWSAYQGYRCFTIQLRIGHSGFTRRKERIWVLCVADMVTFFICTLSGFLALIAFFRLAWPAKPSPPAEGSNVLLIFLLLYSIAGITGKLPELLKLRSS
jgi:hypothetical protein